MCLHFSPPLLITLSITYKLFIMKRYDKIITKYGAGGLLKAGLIGTVLIVNGHNLFIRINGNGWHVKINEVDLIS